MKENKTSNLLIGTGSLQTKNKSYWQGIHQLEKKNWIICGSKIIFMM